MKTLIRVAVVALALSPILSFAQSNEPVTRAQVRADLVELEQAGYDPSNGTRTIRTTCRRPKQRSRPVKR